MELLKIGIVLCLISMTLDSVNSLWKPRNPGPREVCQDQECQKRGNEYLDHLNESAHPCDDFFNFACGNWKRKQKIAPKYVPEWSVALKMVRSIFKVLKDLFEKSNFGGQEKDFARVQTVYKICAARPEYSAKNAANIAAQIRSIRQKANNNVWKLHNEYLEITGESALFKFMYLVHQDQKQPVLLMFTEPISVHGSIFADSRWTRQEQNNYKTFLIQIMKSLGLSRETDSVLDQRISKVLNFREDLGQVMNSNRGKNPSSHKIMTLNELKTWYEKSVSNPVETQRIPWKEIVTVVLKTLSNSIVTKNSIYSIRRTEYILELLKLLGTTDRNVLADHIEIYFVERHLELSRDQFKLLEQTILDRSSRLFSIREQYKESWETCIQELNVGETLEKLLDSKWLRKSAKDKIERMIQMIKDAIKAQLPNRVEQLQEKLDELTYGIGFIPGPQNGAPEPSAYQVLFPNAALHKGHNAIYIHASMIQSPLFSEALPAVYNYAGIGSLIGHELYHFMDNCGKYYDGQEYIELLNWEMEKNCISNTECYLRQYDKIIKREYENRYGFTEFPSADLTYKEDIPDHMGLETAYKAFQTVRKKTPQDCRVLPQFADYNCDHMFFLAYANSHCGYYSLANAKDNLISPHHSSYSVRINGPLSMSADFNRAFECTSTDKMNGQEKCNIWN